MFRIIFNIYYQGFKKNYISNENIKHFTNPKDLLN